MKGPDQSPVGSSRPTLLVAEPEPPQALSVRKLVLETAKFNVLTAHSTEEGIALFHRFPGIDAAVLVRGEGIDCELIAKQIKATSLAIPIIGIRCEIVDYTIPSFEPEQLLELLRRLLGDPRHQVR
jgi:DNA-binding response OmpR family regulator